MAVRAREPGTAAPVPEAGEDPAGESASRRKAVTCLKCGDAVDAAPLADRDDWPWLPTQDKGMLAPHPYCARCGRVKLVGSERALDHGGLVNLVARLSRRLEEQGYRVTDAQRRLILKKLVGLDAADRFSLSREAQLEMVCAAFSAYLHVPPRVVETYVRAC